MEEGWTGYGRGRLGLEFILSRSLELEPSFACYRSYSDSLHVCRYVTCTHRSMETS